MSAVVNELDELMAALPGAVVTDPEVLEGYRRDQAAWGVAGVPIAVAHPAATADVQALARWATRHRIALVPRGAGTGLAGGANASDGCVIVSFERMAAIVSVDAAAMQAVVQPGVLNVAVKDAARQVGLWYPPDPASFEISTIGGNVATNAGGLCCVKYGVTGDYVLGLEVVRADGSALRTGGRTRKNVAGYDLTRLLVGSEGTLALITEITLRLTCAPRTPTTLVATFPSLAAAGHATAAIMRGAQPSTLELMDRATLGAVEAFRPQGLDTDAAAMLIAQTDTAAGDDMQRIRGACEATGATLVVVSDDEAEGRLLMAARRLAFHAVERLGTVLSDDVAVPLPLLPEMLRRIEATAAAHATLVATVAHAGDGNLHPMVVFDRGDRAAEARAVATFEALMAEAIALGGTITGEHGVGVLKRGFLPRQLDAGALALHRGLKRLFDPDGILNPGKVLAPDAEAGA